MWAWWSFAANKRVTENNGTPFLTGIVSWHCLLQQLKLHECEKDIDFPILSERQRHDRCSEYFPSDSVQFFEFSVARVCPAIPSTCKYKEECLRVCLPTCLSVCLFAIHSYSVWPNATKLSKNDLSIQEKDHVYFFGKIRTVLMLQANWKTDQ